MQVQASEPVYYIVPSGKLLEGSFLQLCTQAHIPELCVGSSTGQEEMRAAGSGLPSQGVTSYSL